MPTILRTLIIPALMLVAFTASAATEETPSTSTAPRSADRVAPAPDNNLAQNLTKEFRGDPLFQYMNITIDLYKGLAIVHGGAPNREMVDVVTQKLREKPGVEMVYNYMSNPEKTPAAASIAVTYESFERMQEVGAADNAFTIAGRVMRRLEADAALNRFEFDVDTYMGLVIIHGTVDAPSLVERAKNVARYTEGVEAVLSYVSADLPAVPGVFREPTPIVTREVFVEPSPVPVSVQRVEINCCR